MNVEGINTVHWYIIIVQEQQYKGALYAKYNNATWQERAETV